MPSLRPSRLALLVLAALAIWIPAGVAQSAPILVVDVSNPAAVTLTATGYARERSRMRSA